MTLLDSVKMLYELEDLPCRQILIKEHVVQKATNCHLRPNKNAKDIKKCPVCISNDSLKKYEGTLYHMTKRTKNFEEMSLQGSWKPTLQELIFRC